MEQIRIDKWVRGYIEETKDRKPIVNGSTNDNNNLLSDVSQIKSDFGGAYLKQGYILMDVDGFGDKLEHEYSEMGNPNAFRRVVKQMNLNTVLIKTTHGAWNAIFKSPKNFKPKCNTNIITHCGIVTEYKSTSTKFTVKTNGKLRDMEIIGDPFTHDVDELPFYFKPFNNLQDWQNNHGNTLGDGKSNSGYMIDTYCHKLRYAQLETEEKLEVLNIINDIVLSKPLEKNDYNKYVKQIETAISTAEKLSINDITKYFLNNYELTKNMQKPYFYNGQTWEPLDPVVRNMMADTMIDCPKTRSAKQDTISNIADNLDEWYDDGDKKGHGIDIGEWIATPSGLFNPITMERKDFTSDLFIVGQLRYDIPKESKPNQVDEVIMKLLLNNKQDFDTMFEWFGTVLYRGKKWKNEHMLTLNGSGGTGKSTVIDLVNEVFGVMYGMYDFKRLFSRFGGFDVGEHWLLGSDEMSQDKIKSAEQFKRCTSNNGIQVEEKFRNQQELTYYNCKFMYANNGVTNMEPSCMDAIIRRMLPIRFDLKVADTGDKWDNDKWLCKENCERFLYLAVEGLHRYIDRNRVFILSERSKKELDQYKEEVDNVAVFISEYKELHAVETVDKVFKDYQGWCYNNGYSPANKVNFGKRVKQYGIAKIRRTEQGKLQYLYEF